MNRRTWLRGLGGTMVGLPWLEVMRPQTANAAAGVKRYVVLFGSFSISPDDDPRPNLVVPSRTGAGYDLKMGLLPLAPVQNHVTVVSGLSLKAVRKPDSGSGIPIHWHNDPLFAGGTLTASPQLSVKYTYPTSDQLVADAIGTTTKFKSLAFRVQPSQYLTAGGMPNQGTMSARRNSAGSIAAITPQSSPKGAFDSLFGNFQPPMTGSTPDPGLQLAVDKRRTILDLVDRSMMGLVNRLSQRDQQRLTQHWDEIRSIEKRIEDIPAVPPAPVGSCKKPADPGADPTVGGGILDANQYDSNAGYSNEELRAGIFTDLTAMALACDLTRSVTLMHTWVQSLMNADPIAQVKRTVHDSYHQGGPTVEKSARITAWHMKHYANLIAKLRDLKEENNASVLDSSALIYLQESGIGVDPNGVPNSHSGEGMIAILAGGAGGLKQGVHMIAPPTGPKDVANVLMTGMNAVGMNVNRLGDITGGEIPGLRG